MNEINLKEDNVSMVTTMHSKNTNSTTCVRRLLQVIDYPVIIDIDGHCFEYSSYSDALTSLVKNYLLNRIATQKGIIRIYLTQKDIILNDTDAIWVRKHKQITGEEVSFF